MNAWHIFLTTLQAGLAAVGGGSGTLTVAQRSWVPQYLSPGLFAFAYGLGQITPGPVSVLVVALGYHLDQLAGAGAAFFGISLPTWLVASAAARGMRRFARQVTPYMKAAPWLVVALIVAVGAGLLQSMHLRPLEWVAVLAAAVLVWRKVDPVWILAAALVAGVIWQFLG